jgi:hypothetical protein
MEEADLRAADEIFCARLVKRKLGTDTGAPGEAMTGGTTLISIDIQCYRSTLSA